MEWDGGSGCGAQPGVSQRQLEGDKQEQQPCPGHVVVLGVREVLHVHTGLFKTVNLAEDVFQRLVVGGAEVFAAGKGGYLLQRSLVNDNLLAAEDDASELVDVVRGFGNAVGAQAYGVNFDFLVLGNFGGAEGGTPPDGQNPFGTP